MTSEPSNPSTAAPGDIFATTHWTVVLAAGRRSAPLADRALEGLCRTYWFPLHAYVRRRGHTKEDAEDLTQAFDREWALALLERVVSQLRAECVAEGRKRQWINSVRFSPPAAGARPMRNRRQAEPGRSGGPGGGASPAQTLSPPSCTGRWIWN